MPYIKQHRRADLDATRADVSCNISKDAGGLNFQITRLIDDWLIHEGRSYTKINEVIGVLECAKLELYRRVAVPYENTKIIENGDVYSPENTK